MTIAPKNWHTFQHYKDRSPAWIKLHRGLLDDFGFSRLPVASRALAPLLWLLASEYAEGKITASREEIAFRLRLSTKELEDALRPLIAAGFFIDNNDVAQCEQPASTMLAEREPTSCLEREREEEEEEEKSISVARATAGTVTILREVGKLFDEFWIEYPKRQGANPKEPALKSFLRHIATGRKGEYDAEAARAMIAGAKRYADELRGEGKIGTPFVARAVTFLNEKRWKDYPEKPEVTEPALPPGKFYAKVESAELSAWDDWSRRTRGRSLPRDRAGGWLVDSQWPPIDVGEPPTPPPVQNGDNAPRGPPN